LLSWDNGVVQVWVLDEQVLTSHYEFTKVVPHFGSHLKVRHPRNSLLLWICLEFPLWRRLLRLHIITLKCPTEIYAE